jgi:hypothetical protein
MTEYKIANWERFQHYGDKRTPPWIKLHYEMLTSKDWVKFNDASKLLAVVCMMLASRNKGIVEGDIEYIQQVAHLRTKPDLKPLITSGFLIPASAMLADASTNEEEEKEEEEKEEGQYSFEFFWQAYPRTVSKVKAELAYKTALKKTPHEVIMKGLENYKTDIAKKKTSTEYISHAASWLNGGRWADDYGVAPPPPDDGLDWKQRIDNKRREAGII